MRLLDLLKVVPGYLRRPDIVHTCRAEESQAWLDPIWAAALEEVSVCLEHDTKVTIRAVNKDERRALLRIKRVTPSRVQAIILRPHEPGAVLSRPRTQRCTLSGSTYDDHALQRHE